MILPISVNCKVYLKLNTSNSKYSTHYWKCVEEDNGDHFMLSGGFTTTQNEQNVGGSKAWVP